MADDIRQWLEELGLGKYDDVFVENGVDIDVLPDLADDDLKDIGVNLGDRKRLLRAIAQLGNADAVSASDEVPAKSEKRSTDAERRQLSIMFCDLVGSTTLSRQLDPEDLRDVMRRYQDAVAGAVTRYGGHVAKYLGDGVLAYFGWPQAYEDQAERAVYAGLDAVIAVAAVQMTDSTALAARVGIATGQVVVGDLVGESGRDAEAVTGETPNLAARLQGIAEPGQVVIGNATKQLIGQTFALIDVGKHALKGFDIESQAWQVAGEKTVESRFDAAHDGSLTHFVGRDGELQLLLDRWELAKHGEGQVVLISGEPGIGKSRLSQALRDALSSEPHFRAHYQCSPYHTNSALHPIAQQIQYAAGFSMDDDNEVKMDKLDMLPRRGGDDVAPSTQLFANLLSLPYEQRFGVLEMTPAQIKQGTLQAITDQLLFQTEEQPVLFLFEDAHWIDPTSLELLQLAVAQIQNAHVLIIVTHRPEWQSQFAGEDHVTSLQLNRLGKGQGAAIVRAIAGEHLPDEVVERIVSRTDGVPLFVEELTKSLIESGLDIEGADIPATLQASLLARIDRLGSEAKEIAQIGAVIGRTFQHNLITIAAGKTGDEIESMLDQLIQSELIYRTGTSPDANYTFKHALVQDAAYDSLLRTRRQSLHGVIAQALETQFSGQVEAQPEVLAYHLSEAREFGRAAEFWGRAGQLSLQRSANVEASAQFQKGIDQLSSLPHSPERNEREIELQSNLGVALLPVKGFVDPAVASAYRRAKELCEETGNKTGLFTALWGLWLGEQFSEKYAAAKKLSDDLLTLAHELGDDGLILQAHHAAWTTCFFRGEFEKVIEHTSAVEDLYDLEKHASHTFRFAGHDPGICGRNFASRASLMLGYLDNARRQSAAAIALARVRNHPVSTAQAYYVAAETARDCGDAKSARLHADTTVSIAEEHGHKGSAGYAGALATLAWVLAEDGVEQEALEGIRAVLELPGLPVHRPGFLSVYAEICLKLGKSEDASAAVKEALQLVEKSNDRLWEAELYRQKGEVLLMQDGARDEIEPCFERAIDIAQMRQLRPMALRAATSLARFHADNRERDRAKSLLAPIYDWFTEGFDTPDLIAAKALLDELN